MNLKPDVSLRDPRRRVSVIGESPINLNDPALKGGIQVFVWRDPSFQRAVGVPENPRPFRASYVLGAFLRGVSGVGGRFQATPHEAYLPETDSGSDEYEEDGPDSEDDLSREIARLEVLLPLVLLIGTSGALILVYRNTVAGVALLALAAFILGAGLLPLCWG